MQQNVAAPNEHFAYAFVGVNAASGKDVFDVWFCMLIERTKYDYFNVFLAIFGTNLDWNHVNRKNNAHTFVSLQSFDSICPKILCSLSPTSVMLHIKFD